VKVNVKEKITEPMKCSSTLFFALAKSLTLERVVFYKSHFDQVLGVRPGGRTRAQYLCIGRMNAIKRGTL
jgi:hypothetical protein